MTVRAVTSASSFSSSSEPVLREGARGSAVVTLQNALRAAGFNPGPSDGVFGPGTLAAVQAFQRSRGLSVDGVVGPQTWGALSGAGRPAPAPAPAPAPSSGGHPTLSLGSSGPAVSEMQSDLARAGFNPGGVDGKFGPMTQAALKRFQAAHGLASDGVCGPKTWGALSGSSFTPAPAPSSGGSEPLLRIGATGAAVTRLQTLLQRAGCSPGGIDGSFGPATQAAVLRFQSSRGLSTDGIVGPQTWAALDRNAPAVGGTGSVGNPPPVSGDLRSRILQIAESQIGTTESWANDETGACTKYPNYFGRGPEYWCADFASWVYTHAGDPMNNPYCPSIVNNLKADGKWHTSNPQPGDLVLFCWDGSGTAEHVGIVKSVNPDGSIQTIEGNSPVPGEPDGVWEHTRYMNDILGFGSP